ncbi:PAS-domain containing protein [Ahrensia sp. 13_GOM-1096m]|uniref:PAS-domain containing protein n=1 Tax=Ahrensia sp. 13_GOM-1096m TaxID=1380380 RepID=UPI000A4C0354|nr:PAS-domain containing protein [Ahrensia sp. 13_GOM-1096m]
MRAENSKEARDLAAENLVVQQGIQLIQQALSIFDSDMKLLVYNQRFLEMFDLPEELIFPGLSFLDLTLFLARRGEFGPGDPTELAHDRVERASRFEAHYFERSRPNNRRISVEGHPLEDGGWVTIYSDITEAWRNEQVLRARSDELSDKLLRRTGQLSETNRTLEATNRALLKAKSELEISENRIRAITRAVPAHIAYIDTTFTYQFSNNRFSSVMGIDRHDLVGKTISGVFPKRIANLIIPQLKAAFAGKTVTFSYEVENVKGEIQSVRTTFSPDFGKSGVAQGAFVQSLNVSAEMAATEIQLRAKRLETTNQLTSGLAHDFSNILTVILGNLERLGKHVDEPHSELLRSTEQAARRGTRIIDNLMSYVFSQKLDSKSTNISKLLRDLIRLFASSLSSSISIQLDIETEDIVLQLDEGAFQDALLNLLFNARDAIETHDGEGVITVTARLESSANQQAGILISVSDTGQGFSQDAILKGTEPFFTTKPQGKGTGLGLSMVHGFLEQSGGWLQLKNGTNGGGQVDLYIPIERAEQSNTALDQPHFETEGHLILIVDDDPEMRTLIRNYLGDLGLPCLEADGAEEALTLVKQVAEITGVISDIIMPGTLTGVDLAAQWRQYQPELAVLLISGLPRQHKLLQSARENHTILRKPFDKDVFKQTLIKVLTS